MSDDTPTDNTNPTPADELAAKLAEVESLWLEAHADLERRASDERIVAEHLTVQREQALGIFSNTLPPDRLRVAELLRQEIVGHHVVFIDGRADPHGFREAYGLCLRRPADFTFICRGPHFVLMNREWLEQSVVRAVVASQQPPEQPKDPSVN